MQVRLTTIDLALDGQVHPVGAVLVVGDQIPAELAERRLAARTAELVVSGEAIPPAIAEALAALDRAGLAVITAGGVLLDLVEAQPPTVVLAVIDALGAAREASVKLARGIEDRLDRLHEVASEARHAAVLLQGGAAPATPDPALAADPASVGSQLDGVADSAPPGGGAEAPPNDNPAESGGVGGAVAEASAPAAKPARAAKAKTPAADTGGGA